MILDAGDSDLGSNFRFCLLKKNGRFVLIREDQCRKNFHFESDLAVLSLGCHFLLVLVDSGVLISFGV